MERLIQLFERHYSQKPLAVSKLPGAGSQRTYYRLHGNGFSVIGTIGSNRAENEAFVMLDRFFAQQSLPVPELIAVSPEMDAYLQEDLGDESLFDLVSGSALSCEQKRRLLEEVVEILASFHNCGCEGLDLSKCYPRRAMDSQCVMWDLNYFKYCFLKLTGVEIDEERLEQELGFINRHVAVETSCSLILRDFQSRNIMVNNGRLFFIDFQGARLGHPLYDVASFLWQARLGLPDALKWELAEKYAATMRQYGHPLAESWRRDLMLMALFRMLQVLGAYGLRGLHEHKAQFVTCISAALDSTLSLLQALSLPELSYIAELLGEVAGQPRFKPQATDGRLKVKVMSFSYKKGVPEDYTGNGGGFVFDCRAVHNPGRYDEYKKLTGMDVPVIEFLEKDGEILRFMDHCYGLVDPSVERYMKRGFTNLMVCFGCTGGQHRSVYGAEAMAHHIARKYDVDVELIHREQGVEKQFVK